MQEKKPLLKPASGQNPIQKPKTDMVQSKKKQYLPKEEQERLDKLLYRFVAGSDSTKLERLIEAGADIATTDGLGWTPLHSAANHGATKNCIFLLVKYAEAGGDVKKLIDMPARDGTTAIMVAESTGKTKTAALLESISALETPFMNKFVECMSSK